MVNGAKRVEATLQIVHVGNAKGAEIEDRAGAIRDDIGARAAFDDASVDGDAASKIVPFFDARELLRQFVNGVDPFLRREAGVRGAAMHDQCGLADTLARGFQQAARTIGRLENEDSIAAARLGFEELAGGFAADLFVGSPKEDEAFAKRRLCFLQCLQREKRLNDAGLHVECPRAICFTGGNAEGHFAERTAGVDGVVMTEDQELSYRAGFVR